MADRQIVWSLAAKVRDLRKGTREAERDLNRVGKQTTALSKVAEAAAKRDVAIATWRDRRLATAQNQVSEANVKAARSYGPLSKAMGAYQKIQQRQIAHMHRVHTARQREIEQNVAVVKAREAEATALSALTKAQEKHVLINQRANETLKHAKATESQRTSALQAVKRVTDELAAAQDRYTEAQQRTTVVVEETTRTVHRSRSAWALYRKDTEGAFDSIRKKGTSALIGLVKVVAKFGVIGAIAVPVVLGLVSAVAQLGGGAYAMLSALGPAVGLLAVIPQMALGAGAALGTLLMGFNGLGGALKAATKAEEEMTEAEAKARAEMSASERAAYDYQRALAALPKETRSFAKYLVSLKPKLKELRNASAKGLMPGAEKGLRSIMKLFPTVKRSVGDMGKVFGDSFARFGKAMSTATAQGQFKRVMASNTVVAGTFARSMEVVGRFMLSLADSARGLTEWIAKGTEAWLKNAVASFEAAKKAGKVKKFFAETKDVLKTLGNTFKNILVGLKNIGVVGYDSGKGLADSFEDATAKFKKWTEQDASKSKMRKFFEESKETVEAIGRVLKDIGVMIGRTGMPSGRTEEVPQSSVYSSQVPGAAPAQTRPQASFGAMLATGLEDMMPTLQSIIDTLSQNMGTGAIEAIKSILEAFDAFLQNGGAAALGTFAEVLATVAGVIKTIVEIPNVGPVLGGVATALGALAALKFVGKWTGLTAMGRAIGGFYRDSKRPKGWTPPTDTGVIAAGAGGVVPVGGKAGRRRPRWLGGGRAPAPVPVGFAPTPVTQPRQQPGFFGGLFGRGAKKPPRTPKPRGRFRGALSRLAAGRTGKIAGGLGSAAGAAWLATQFIDPESELGTQAGNLSSILSAAMFVPMVADVVSPLGRGAMKAGRGIKRVAPKVRPKAIKGGLSRLSGGVKTRAGKVGGAVKSTGGALAKGTKNAISGIGTAAGKAGSKVASLASSFATFASMVGGKLMQGLRSLGTHLGNIARSAGGLVKSFAKGGFRLISSLFSGIGKAVGFLAKGFLNLATKVLPMVGRAFAVLGRAMFMNPFGLIVLAIIALVAAFVLLYKKNETFRKFVQKAWAKIKDAVKVVVDWLVNTAWPVIKKVWDFIWKGIKFVAKIVLWQWKLIWAGIKVVANWLVNTAWPWIKKVWDRIGQGAKTLWRDYIKPAMKWIKDGVGSLVDKFKVVRDAIGKVWNGLVDKISGPIRKVVAWINKNFIGKINWLLNKLGLSWSLPYLPSGVKNTNTSPQTADGRAGGITLSKGGGVGGTSPTTTADNIPAWLTAGEFVTRVKSVRRMAREFPGYLEHINKYGRPPERHAAGGAVGTSGRRERWFKSRAKDRSVKADTQLPKYGLGGFVKDAWDFFQNTGAFVKDKVNDLLDRFGLKEFLRNVTSGVGTKALKGLANWAREKMQEFFGEGGDSGTHQPRNYNSLARVRSLIASSGIPGLSITSTYRSPAMNARVGGVPNSLHTVAGNPAVDIGGSTSALNQFYALLRAAGGWSELLWQVPGHFDHIHAAAQGGLVPSKGVLSFANGVPRADSYGGLTFDVPGYHKGGAVRSMKPGASGKWVTGVYRLLSLDRDNTRWGSDLTKRLRRWFNGAGLAPSDRSRNTWASRLKLWATRNRTKSMRSLSAFVNRDNAGYMNYQRLIWLSRVRPDAWKAVKTSKQPSAVWLEKRFGQELKERGDLIYALQNKIGFGGGREGTTLDRTISGPSEWESVKHALYHGLGRTHGAYLARPWAPRSAGELAVRAQQDANKAQSQFNSYLDILARWGLGYTVDHLLEMGVEEGLPLAKSLSSNRRVATDYEASLKAKERLVATSSPEAVKFIAAVASSSEPLGIRALARLLGLPDFGVVQMYEQLLAAKRLTKGPRTARLDREVPLFRSGLFYAHSGGKVPGTGSGDVVPAMLTPGEFVLRKAAVKALGMQNVRALNNLQFFASGGPVFPVAPATPAIPASTAQAIRRGVVSREAAAGIINIRTNIFNPVREPSTASMHRMLRQQAAQGLFGQDMRSASVVMVKPEGS